MRETEISTERQKGRKIEGVGGRDRGKRCRVREREWEGERQE